MKKKSNKTDGIYVNLVRLDIAFLTALSQLWDITAVYMLQLKTWLNVTDQISIQRKKRHI